MRRAGVFLGVIISFISINIGMPVASAATKYTDWTTADNITHEYLPEQDTKTCVKGIWSIETEPNQLYAYPEESAPQTRCVYHQKDFVYTTYARTRGQSYYSYREGGIAVAKGDNIEKGILTPISNTDLTLQVIYAGNSSEFVIRALRGMEYNLLITKDFISTLAYDEAKHSYTWDSSKATYLIDTPTGNTMSLFGYSFSNNGKWLAVVTGNSVIRINREDNSRLEMPHNYVAFAGYFRPAVSISEDGNTAAMGNTDVSRLSIFHFNASNRCVPTGMGDLPDVTLCPIKNLSWLVMQYPSPLHAEMDGGINPSDLQLNHDGTALVYRTDAKYGVIWHRLSISPQPILQYLALGDSYASGEGDDNPDNYLAGTNVFGDYKNGIPRENCHISSRSYPFLLGAGMSLAYGSDARSVACSGAMTTDVVSSTYNPLASTPAFTDSTYLGQSTQAVNGFDASIPRLSTLSNAEILKSEARTNYLPGRVQQIEMVQKLKPAVATFSIGGNDLGFGDELTSCVLNLSMNKFDQTCDVATPDGRKQKAQEIHDSYDRLKNTYTSILKASQQTRLFVIGYPKFLVAKQAICTDTLFASISQTERTSINELIDYANATIRYAARDAGATFIDTTDALGDEAACGGSTAVTGVDNLFDTAYQTYAMKLQAIRDSNITRFGQLFGSAINGLNQEFGLETLYLTPDAIDAGS